MNNGNASTSVPANDPPVDDTTGISRERFVIRQPNGWSCAPTALAEACFDFCASGGSTGIKFDGATFADPISRMAMRQRVENLVGEPQQEFQSIDEMAVFAQQLGLSTILHFNPNSGGSITPQTVDEAMKALDAALAAGHGVIINVPHHFMYCAGKTPDGLYIVGDPADPWTATWNTWRMSNELDHQYDPFNDNWNPTPTGFVEVWNPNKPVHDHLVSIANPAR
jgi:hypothetical protein